MKRLLFFMVLVFISVDVSAQRKMRDFIKTMPDSLVPYLNTTKRTELVDFYEMRADAVTNNLLMENTVLDSLTAIYADIRLNESSRMQLGLLTQENGDTLICVLRTYLGEAPETTIAFYDEMWRLRDASLYLSPVDTTSLMQRPDTMTVERYEQLVRLVDPVMVAAEMLPSVKSLTFSLSIPLLSEADKKELKTILVQRNLNWNGRKFN